MKILILSDCHGNKFGLQAVLDSGRSYDRIVCLGDVVGYGAHPNECCEMLREREAISLSGNHDAAVLSKIDIQWFNLVAQQAVMWTRQHLKAENHAWLDALPAEQIFEEWGFQAVHGSLRQPWEEYIVDADTALFSFERMTKSVCFYGHTHVCDLYALEQSAENYRLLQPPIQYLDLPFGGLIPLDDPISYLINPGSCGQPRDGNPQAKAAIFDVEAQEIEVFGVDYDIEAARAAILEAGLPSRLGDRLRNGN